MTLERDCHVPAHRRGWLGLLKGIQQLTSPDSNPPDSLPNDSFVVTRIR